MNLSPEILSFGGAPVPVLDPRVNSNLYVHYDATDTSKVLDGSSLPSVEGSTVSMFNPCAGSGVGVGSIGFTNTLAGGYRPTFRASVAQLNGLPAVEYTTANSMVSAGMVVPATCAIIASYYAKTIGASGASDVAFDSVNSLYHMSQTANNAAKQFYYNNGTGNPAATSLNPCIVGPYVELSVYGAAQSVHIIKTASVTCYYCFAGTNFATFTGFRWNGRGNGSTTGIGAGRQIAQYQTGLSVLSGTIQTNFSMLDLMRMVQWHWQYLLGQN